MTEREMLATGIRRALLRRGLTTADVGRRLNLGQSTVAKWSSGAARPGPTNLRRLCVLLDVDESDLRAGLADIFGDLDAAA